MQRRVKKTTRKNLLASDKRDNDKLKILAVVIVVFIAGFIAYFPSLNNGFTNWDDPGYVLENKLVNTSGETSLKTFFTEEIHDNYHPLTMISLALDYKISGKNPFFYHFHNLLLHLFNSVLVFFVFYLFCEGNKYRYTLAAITSMLFSVHTMHVESVAWVSERKDVLYAFFYLLSLIFYLLYVKKNKVVYYLAALVIFLFSMLSKGQAVTLAVVIVGIDYFKGRNLKNIIVISEKLPFFIISFLFGIIAIKAQGSSITYSKAMDYPFYERILYAGYSFMQYILKLIVPYKLSAFYPYPKNLSLPFFIAPLFAAALISVLFYFRKNKMLIFGSAFFLVNILLLLQLLPVGNAMMADRYTYIASAGFFFLLATGFVFIREKYKSISGLVMILFVVYAFALGVSTFQRTKIWNNSISLWDDVLKKYENVPQAWNNRGLAKKDMKMYNEAITDFTGAVKHDSSYYFAYNNRGLTRYDMGDLKAALADYNKVIAINNKYLMVYNNRGRVKMDMGYVWQAIMDFDKVLNVDPKEHLTLNNKGIAFAKAGKYKDALKLFDSVIAINPSYTDAYSNKGNANHILGNYTEALNDYQMALDLNPLAAEAYANRGVVKIDMKNTEGAIEDFTKAIEVNPDYSFAYYIRGMVYYDSGKKNEGCADLAEAMKLGNREASVSFNDKCR